MQMKFCPRSAFVSLLLLVGGSPAFGQAATYPTQVISIVTPTSPGGLSWILAQLTAKRLEERQGKPVIVESKPGAGSVIATEHVVRSAPDGHTILLNTTSAIASAPIINKNRSYDPATDLIPIAQIAELPQVLVVNASLPIRTIEDLTNHAKSKAGGLTFGSVGVGSSQHLFGELLKSSLKIELVHASYKGPLQSLQDVATGYIEMMFTDIQNALPFIERGQIRPIAVAMPRRVSALPEVPSLTELQLPAFNLVASFVFYVPSKTPAPIVERLHSEIRHLFDDEEVRKQFSKTGVTVIDSPAPAELARALPTEYSNWADMMRKAGLPD
jgi:tripartite-type tricarboxylate transporter receptor subunit TctC